MAILAIIGKILASLGGGSILGVLGALGKEWLGLKKARQDNAHELALRRQDLEMRKLDIAGQVRIEDRKADAAEEQARAAALAKSYETDRRTYSLGLEFKGKWGRFVAGLLGLTDVARGWVRILGTAYAFVALTAMAGAVCWFFYLHPEILTANQAKAVEMGETVFYGLLAVFSTCVTWWYAGRPIERRTKQDRD